MGIGVGLLSQLVYYSQKILQVFWVKVIIGILLAALAPQAAALSGLITLFCIDLGCGVWVACKTKTLSSYGMRRGFAKLILYVVFICTVAVCEHNVLHTDFVTFAAIGLLSATEVLSIMENLVLLGLPIPYAAQILKIVGSSAKAWGINVAEDPGAAAAIRDMVTILEATVPELTDPVLRTCLDEFTKRWYQHMRGLATGDMIGDLALVRVRSLSQLDRVLNDIRSDLSRHDIDAPSQRIFLDSWCRQVLSRLYSEVGRISGDGVLTDNQKIDQMRDQIVLMCLRVAAEAERLDKAGSSALATNPALVVTSAS
jgi:phage-related holin